MKTVIMQPYFMPTPGYFSMLNESDTWVYFGEVQFRKKSWITRNKITNPQSTSGWVYFGLNCKKSTTGNIIDKVELVDTEKTLLDIKNKIRQLTNFADYIEDACSIIEEIAIRTMTIRFLGDFLLETYSVFYDLGILNKHAIRSTEIDFNRENIEGPGDWAPEISRSIAASTYINPTSGRELFDKKKFREYGVELLFYDYPKYNYNRKSITHHELCSILDLIAFVGIEESRNIVRKNDENLI